MRKHIKLPSVSRVAPGSIATLEFPVGPTYKRIIFACSGTALAINHFKRLNVYFDGKIVMTFKDLQRLIDLNVYYNRGADSAASWAIHFDRAEMMDAVYRRAPGIGTADLQTMHMEIELDATAPANIKVDAFAEVDPVPQKLGVFFKVREYPYNSATSGQVEVDKLPRGAYYGAVHLFKADISAIEVTADQVKIIDATKAVLERFQREASPRVRVPLTAKATHIDWMTEGDIAESIYTAALQDFRIRMTLDTAGAVDIITETLDTLGG